MIFNDDTICAIATAPGGAIGIVRVSGERALEAVDGIFRYKQSDKGSAKGGICGTENGQNGTEISANGCRSLALEKSHTLHFGDIVDENGAVVDEVLVSVFRTPHSYTGENAAEISCHSSQYILQEVMRLLVSKGCRLAEGGEFTKRAFLNGKMDLAEAEAVADVIGATCKRQHDVAIRQMRGGFSGELETLRQKLLRLTSLMELELDFSDHEELEFASREELLSTSRHIYGVIERLWKSFSLGNAIKNGVPVAIVGLTNAGKSTLLNALVGEQRAIVSDIHGTTRDFIEDTANIQGTIFRFTDTAGVRSTSDEIERQGIERAIGKLDTSDIVVLMIDISRTPNEDDLCEIQRILSHSRSKHLIVALNKADLGFTAENMANVVRQFGFLEQKGGVLKPKGGVVASPLAGGSCVGGCSEEFDILAFVRQSIEAAFPDDFLSVDVIKFSLRSGSAERSLSVNQPKTEGQSASFDWSTVQDFKALLLRLVRQEGLQEDFTIVTTLRHAEALRAALQAAQRVISGLKDGLPQDLVCQDLRLVLHHLGTITGGEIQPEEVLQNIFKHFCIGK